MNTKTTALALLLALTLALIACTERHLTYHITAPAPDGDADSDADSDSDGDADTSTGQDTQAESSTDTDTLDHQDSDTDTDSDSDSESDTASDTTPQYCAGDGMWRDDLSGLCWQDPPSPNQMHWPTAVAYCEDMDHGDHSDWRLPNIDELISLIRGCWHGTSTGDLCPSACEMMPAGCVATDDCSNAFWCSPCLSPTGPDDGCYRDPGMTGACVWLWSSSSAPSSSTSDRAWQVAEFRGYADPAALMWAEYVRCVRGGPR